MKETDLLPGQLKKMVEDLFDQAAKCDVRILSSLDQAEHTIELDYRGRYFFELLQNARDAAASIGAMARVKVVVRSGEMLVANTGVPFSEEGLKSICSLGLSTKKNSKLFIGNKGLGFKAILEITDRPRIVTKAGTVVFSREKAHERLAPTGIQRDEIPLLFLPMYESADLHSFPGFEEYSTLLIMPFRAGITAERVLRDIRQIKDVSYALIRNFEKLDVVDEEKKQVDSWQVEYKNEDICQISLTGFIPLQIKLYNHAFTIIKDKWDQLSADEQKLFPVGSEVEIVIALRLNSLRQYQSFEDVPLFLYYPLEDKSGFGFIIHSQFVATPNRKGLLENSVLNQLILNEILVFISGTFLRRISEEFPAQVSEILTHVPNSSSMLNKYGFYMVFQHRLSREPILWNDTAGRLLRTDEFLLTSQEQKDLFKEPMMGNRYLVHIPITSPTYQYLVKYMNAKNLDAGYISTNIEKYTDDQLAGGHIGFFPMLYNYVAGHKIPLAGRKILLTEQQKLVDSKTEVYYGSQRTDIHIPVELSEKFVFLHRSIALRDARIAEGFIGLTEYNTEQLTRKALSLFTRQAEIRPALLRLFMSLYLDRTFPKNLLETVQVPVSGQVEWVSPLSNAVYWPSHEMAEMYPEGLFVDMEKLPDLAEKEMDWKIFLMALNIWSAPAVHLVNKGGKLDIVLDIPATITARFEKFIFEQWGNYQSRIEAWRSNLPLWGLRTLPPLADSGFVLRLRELEWLSDDSGGQPMVRPSQVLVFPEADRYGAQLKPLTKYFTLYYASAANQSLLQLTGAKLPRALTFTSSVQLFQWAQAQFAEMPPQEKEFASAWNRLYSLLFEFWRSTRSNDPGRALVISVLKSSKLLAEMPDGNRKKWVWATGFGIIYVDDQPFLDNLRESEQRQLPPRFTKKDRTEIGVIISKVGLVLSEHVTRDLITPVILQQTPFLEFFRWSLAAVAVLEDKSASRLTTDQMLKLRSYNVAICQNLSVSISINIGAGARFTQPAPFYFPAGQGSPSTLFIDESSQRSRKTISAAVQELFGRVTDEDHEMLLELQELASARTESEALKILSELNIDPERVAELKADIGYQEKSRRLIFWNTLATVVGVTSVEEESMLTVIFSQLAAHYPTVESDFWQAADEKMCLNKRWTWATLLAVREVLKKAGLDADILLAVFDGKVDIAAMNKEQVRLLLQSRRPFFVAAMYRYLVDKAEKAKIRFLDILNQYDRPAETPEFRSFRFEPEKGFELHLRRVVADIGDESFWPELTLQPMDDLDLYKVNKAELEKRVREAGLPSAYLSEFLDRDAVKSLLFFNVESVFAYYQEYAIRHDEDKGVGEDGDPSDQSHPENNNPVVPHVPRKPTPRISPTGSGGSGQGGSRGNGGQPPNPDVREETGRWGERYVFNKLRVEIPNLKWVSKNAEFYDDTIRGDDDLHYDMKYLDAEGKEQYIEVKSTSGTLGRFNISHEQVAFGIANKHNYHLYFVVSAGNSQMAQAKYLGTIFTPYNSLHDFESTQLIEVEAKDYVVSFD